MLELNCVFLLQLKTQLTETLSKLETEESERQKVAGDLYKVGFFLTCCCESNSGHAGSK